MTIVLHGIKNDYNRDGITVTIPQCNDPDLDPVRSLQEYMHQTNHIRQHVPHRPVFLTLDKPYRALSSRGISSVLNEIIHQAGLGSRGFSAKCFRPAGATTAINLGMNPDTVRHIGRWKSQEVFEKHYVHNRVLC